MNMLTLHRALQIMAMLVMAPIVAQLPWPIGVLVFAVLAARFRLSLTKNHWKQRIIRTALAMATIALLLSLSRQLLVTQGGVSFLICMVALKTLESKTQRDQYILVFLNYLIIATYFIFYQSALITLYALVLILVNTAALHMVTIRRIPRVRSALKISAGAWVLGLPVAIVLFYLFPRLDTPLWNIFNNQNQAVSGLSNQLSPGDISKLSRSDAVAFRVEFEGDIPNQEQLYWRGPVLENYTGRRWLPFAPPENDRATIPNKNPENEVAYKMYIEPHQQRWVLALDSPTSIPARTHLSSNYQIIYKEQITRTRMFELRSVPSDRINVSISNQKRFMLTNLPTSKHPKTKALIDQWKSESQNNQQLVSKVLSWFRQEAFYYTLEPPLVGDDFVDEFLFESRRGFCEHYAYSFAVMMRLAGIPARIVAGYQGGKLHPSGEYMIVRQSEAHAWTEIWLEGTGWLRVDPTSYVAPNRVEQGLDAALGDNEPVPGLAKIDIGWLQQWRLQLDYMDAMWNRWVVAYNQNTQKQLLKALGLKGWVAAVIALIGAVFVLVLIGALLILRKRPKQHDDEIAKAYKKWLKQLQKLGIIKAAHQGPLDFADQVIEQLPHLAEQTNAVTKQYMLLRYSPSSNQDTSALAVSVAKFHAKLKT